MVVEFINNNPAVGVIDPIKEKIKELKNNNSLYHQSNEMGECFITIEQVEEAYQGYLMDGLFIIYYDVLTSGDPMYEGWFELDYEEAILEFLNSNEWGLNNA